MPGTHRDAGHTPASAGAKSSTGSGYPSPTGANTSACTPASSATRSFTGTSASPIPRSITGTSADAWRNRRPRNIRGYL